MTNKISDLLNMQINAELYSAYLYLDFAKHFDCNNLKGFANWFKIQANEEIAHAMKFYDYMQDQGCYISLETIDAPNTTDAADLGDEQERHLAVLKQALTHEKHVTALINTIYTEADKIGDIRTMNFLDWFISEQAEEETNARNVVKLVELVGDNTAALYLLDVQMGKRKA